MIYRANNDTKRICLRIRKNQSDVCCNEITLAITPLECEEPPKQLYQYSPCGGFEPVKIEREPTLTLLYDMFDRDENGNVCFLLDSQFAELPCGRYNAVVNVCGCCGYKFQIDKRETLSVSHITTDDRSNCCEGKYGC